MTREVAIEILKEDSCVDCACANMSYAKCEYEGNCDIRTAMNMALEALKVQPCEDAVKREAVLNTLDAMDVALDENRTVESYKELLRECYKELPPVTPKPTECENAVDRDTIIREMENRHKDGDAITLGYIKNLPPVTPKPAVLEDIKLELWDSGMNMGGEYQGVWVRYRDIEKIINKHISGGEQK